MNLVLATSVQICRESRVVLHAMTTALQMLSLHTAGHGSVLDTISRHGNEANYALVTEPGLDCAKGRMLPPDLFTSRYHTCGTQTRLCRG